MKKFSLLTLLPLATMLFSCGNKDTRNMEFEGYKFSEMTEVTEKDSLDDPSQLYWLCSGSGVLPVKSGDADIDFLRDSLERLAMVHFENKVAEPRLRKFLRKVDVSKDSVQPGSQSTDILSIVLANSKVIVWQDLYQEYIAGAAHGMYTYSFVNYSIEHNKILGLSDLLKPGYQTPLTALLRNSLSDDHNLLVSTDEVEIPTQFRITPDGLEFLWQVYDIAPYSEGVVKVELSGWDLVELLTPLGKDLLEVDY